MQWSPTFLSHMRGQALSLMHMRNGGTVLVSARLRLCAKAGVQTGYVWGWGGRFVSASQSVSGHGLAPGHGLGVGDLCTNVLDNIFAQEVVQ